ncbi:response regulator [Desulfosporosinus fructosivorans]|uniref:Stage 0 sporulation protein A homolog n=1 Tax=Desulfosporosinus fructosivorans TaxID=2018669 RepID=A0A4Z0RAB2_9FIRM|nr:response regulator [Desulfosporosinus fructosivorans]TGE38943.1 response regulator [Desulfosporosinus fructosivorans]
MNILLVDDRRENLLALEAVLKSPDYNLIFASCGEEALKCLLKDDFAVILLDVQMPGLDGFETAKLIRARKKNKDTPIIFITAIYQTTENIVKGYTLGAIDYLFKPFDPQTLKLKIEAFVKIHLNQKQMKLQNELLTQWAFDLEKMNECLELTTSNLRRAEALARVIGETSTDTVITMDGLGYILNVNPAVTEMFGYGHEELLAQHVSGLFPGKSFSIQKSFRGVNNRSKVLDATATRKDGVAFPVEVQISVANIEGQQIHVCSVRDITERKLLEEERKDQNNTLRKLVQERTCELFQANEKLKEEILGRKKISKRLIKTSLKLTNILESITDVFFTLNHQWQFIFVNKEAEKYWQKGRDELIGRNIWAFFPEYLPEYYPLFMKAMSRRAASHFEIKGIHSDESYEVHVYPSDEGLSVYYHNISERRMFEKEMARLERLNLVGQMAAGIGHEIRNPMTTVRGFLQLLGAKEEFQQSKDYFQLMIEELDRANSIITEFLSLAKNKTVDLKPLSLNYMIGNLLPLLQADALVSDKDIIMELQDTVVLLLDEKEIRQLILNLVRNGLEAMPAGGKLTIRTFMDGVEPVLAVGDEGCGIKSVDLEKIGTPFFTTKENGTGLGLATCFSISARHNAEIQIDTGPSGTTIFVRFKLPIDTPFAMVL